MTYNERNDILQSGDYIGKIRIAFYDWLNYWSTNGTESIEDNFTKERTETLLHMALVNPEVYVNKLVVLAISETSIKDAAEITDSNVSTAVTHLLATALQYLL